MLCNSSKAYDFFKMSILCFKIFLVVSIYSVPHFTMQQHYITPLRSISLLNYYGLQACTSRVLDEQCDEGLVSKCDLVSYLADLITIVILGPQSGGPLGQDHVERR